MANPFKKLIEPRLPPAAIGISKDDASVVALERRRDVFGVRRAGHAALPEGLLHPNFDSVNITDAGEFTEILAELVTNVGLLKRRRWSVALPEAATRTAIVTLESVPASRGELEEMLRWKTERAIGAPPDELRVARQRLAADAEGRARYLVTAMRLDVLGEYESVFASLGWHMGLVLPRHMGEAWWLMRDGASAADALLVSAHEEGFTAVLLRRGQPLLVRTAICEQDDCADELYRFILFYRDRLTSSSVAGDVNGVPVETIERLLVTGSTIDREAASATIAETLSVAPRIFDAEDVRLAMPSSDLDFNLIAAPAGLAALSWS
ncbi:MAG TPA: hypothetical protein VF666_13895 [Pyrinomonadaceae bacterium]|jgi:hypothetical protein